MIPIEVETRIALFYFRRYFPEDVDLNLSSLLLPYYLDDEGQPSADGIDNLAIELFKQTLREYK